MKFPYGLCNFNKIITKGYLYIDRTERIPLIESAGENLLFLRPRRFGKSLLLSMLQNYYDIGCAEKFEQVFGNLAIGRNPTSSRNQYFILKFDFSCVDPTGLAADIKKALYNHINSRIEGFILDYEDFLKRKIRIDPDDALVSLTSLVSVSRKSGYPIYLLIDEYDNFANEVMMGSHDKKAVYKALVFEEGPLKTFFKTIKSFTDGSGIDRIFITGVSPVVMSDITSGYNIGDDIFLDPDFNDLCGFTEKEIGNIMAELADECGLAQIDVQNAVDLMRTYYNGYLFSPDARMTVFNPTLAIYFMKAFCKRCKGPRQLLDANLAMDEAKLQYISQISGGKQMILDLVKKNHQINVPALEDRFGISDMLSETGKDTVFMASVLYYSGLLTIEAITRTGKLALKIPNFVIHGLYASRLKHMLIFERLQYKEII
ncbi:AAA family ATPase [Desulfobacterales bacterium HSG16]|nr:AAA family ATPase [Desulfobacterales bacterium HSG16]